MGLFGNKVEKRAEEAAAQEAVDRLVGLPVADLAVEILPAFGPDGPGKGTRSIGVFQIGQYLLRDFPHSKTYMQDLLGPIREGTQVLEHAELVEIRATNNGGVGARVRATRLGLATIEDGSGAERLRVA